MDFCKAASKLRPGTAWIQRGDDPDPNKNILEQAEDGTPRVEIPKIKEIQDYIKANPESVVIPIEKQMSAIWAYLKKKEPELPLEVKDILSQVDVLPISDTVIVSNP